MADPTPTPMADRIPGGNRFKNGYRLLIVFANNPTLALWERGVMLSGVDAGDMIDITTQHNNVLRQMAFRALKTITDASFEAGFDQNYMTQMLAQCGVNTSVTVYMPTGDGVCFHGGLKSMAPPSVFDGDFPVATCTLSITNIDPADGSESAPVFVAHA